MFALQMLKGEMIVATPRRKDRQLRVRVDRKCGQSANHGAHQRRHGSPRQVGAILLARFQLHLKVVRK